MKNQGSLWEVICYSNECLGFTIYDQKGSKPFCCGVCGEQKDIRVTDITEFVGH